MFDFDVEFDIKCKALIFVWLWMPCDTYLITVSLTSTITQLMQIKLQSIDWVTVIFLIAQPTQLACTPFGNFRLTHKNCNISFCAEERFPLFLSAVKSWKGESFFWGEWFNKVTKCFLFDSLNFLCKQRWSRAATSHYKNCMLLCTMYAKQTAQCFHSYQNAQVTSNKIL